MTSLRRDRGAITAVALLILSSFAQAQMNTAEISGVVEDASGAVIPGAGVTAVQLGTQLKFTAATNETGHYALEQLPLGDYSLTVSAARFKEAVDQHVILHVGDHVRVDFALEVGKMDEIIIVEETAELLQKQSAEINDVIENQQVLDLPEKDREFLEVALLGGGVVNPPGGTRGDSLQQTGKLINILGQRTGHNLFLLDGVSVTDEYYNNVVLNPSLDDIQEFNLDKTNYSAEFGGKSGGVINVITKSGTNALHGDAYEFIRNNIFDARNFFDPAGQPAPPFRENQFGAALGGPVVRNKTFFFVNYEGQIIRESLAHVFSVPTAAERTGNFSGLAVIDDPSTHQPFPGNVIGQPLSPAALALLAKVPLPNLPGSSNNLLSVAEQSNNTNQYNARLDHQFSSTDNASARASVFDAHELDPFGSSVLNEALLPGFGRTLDTRSVNLLVSEIHTFSPNLLNELRFGWLRVSGGQGDPNAGSNFAAQYGLEGTTRNPSDFGYPQVSLSNAFTTMGDATGFTTRIDRDFEFYDNVTVARWRAHAAIRRLLFSPLFQPLLSERRARSLHLQRSIQRKSVGGLSPGISLAGASGHRRRRGKRAHQLGPSVHPGWLAGHAQSEDRRGLALRVQSESDGAIESDLRYRSVGPRRPGLRDRRFSSELAAHGKRARGAEPDSSDLGGQRRMEQ